MRGMDEKLIDATFVVQAAHGVGLELAPEHVPGVVTYFKMINAMATAVNGLPLDEESEHAAVFTPCSAPARD
jgi:hypothetical protein